MKLKQKPALKWAPIDFVEIHAKAKEPFHIAQQFRYQSDTRSIPLNLIGTRSYDVPLALREGDEAYHVFAGWEPLQRQFFCKGQQTIALLVINERISLKHIEQKAWAYLFKQISCTLSEKTFLVHTFQFAQKCKDIKQIVDVPDAVANKPHLLTEYVQQVGRKRAKRQLSSFFKQLHKITRRS